MLYEYLFNLFTMLVITIIIEFIVYIIIMREQVGWLFLYAVLINLFTWPLANLFYSTFGLFWIIEFFTMVIELIFIMFLFKVNWKKAFIISLIANILTGMVSFIIK
jgi:hypothetical protein